MARRLVLAVLLIVVGFAGGLVVTGRLQMAQESAAGVDENTPPPAPVPAVVAPVQPATGRQPAGDLPDFADVAARTVGAVVNISAMQVVRTYDPFSGFFGDDMFGYRRGQSAGSGVMVTPDGYILTNNHVVDARMQQITVILGDRREREAKLVAADPATDLAVLKIEGRNLPTMPWGDSSHLRVADWVLAIGNPYQLSSTVTLGIVSALGRSGINVASYEDFIQTDAAINPGNSGGALVNKRGELIGINTAIFSEGGGYQGIGFAVPSNLARRVMNDLIEFGEVRRGSLGAVRTVSITEQLAEELRLRSTRGALVWQMSRDSSAYEAGIRPGDVIEAINGQPLDDPNAFTRAVADAPIGSTATIVVRREGRTAEFKVAIERARTQQAGGAPQRRRM
jgi:Do/DeqQ family serine protease